MANGIVKNELDPEIVYADIFHHPHHQSETHKHMSLYDRAAQFAPFAALTGYDDMVREEARYVEQQAVVDGPELELLNQKLTLISDVLADGAEVTVSITYFIPDPKKKGGKYATITEKIKSVDTASRQLVLLKTVGRAGRNMAISFDDISEIHGELVDYLDDVEVM